ncbi:MAG: DUF6572 domain-containing protein [Myxococcaceae bacterium]|nr:DUF6572 domain-containing protein [Myxococcaceae bacterium]
MTIAEADVVDAVGIEVATGDVVLTIADHLVLAKDHLALLQSKLDVYVELVRSGELVRTYPAARGRRVVIELIPNEVLPLEALEFISSAAVSLSRFGILLRTRYLSDTTGARS